MPELSPEQAKQLEHLEKRVDMAWAKWLRVYKQQAREDGVAVSLSPGQKERQLWEELSALRAERNDLLEQFRSGGINI